MENKEAPIVHDVSNKANQQLVTDRAFGYESEENAEEFVEKARQKGFEAGYTGKSVYVTGPNGDMKQFLTDPNIRELLGAEDASAKETFMAEDFYESSLQTTTSDSRVMTDGGKETDFPTQEYYSQLGNTAFTEDGSAAGYGNNSDRVMTDGGHDSGAYEQIMFSVDHESALEEVGTLFEASE